MIPIPLFSSAVPAGFPSPAEDHVEKSLDLHDHLIEHPAATFFVRVVGESMKGAGIQSGDLLIVDRSIDSFDGKIVVAVVEGEFTVKRARLRGKELFLMPENPLFSPIAINEESDCLIWGVVTYVIHKCTT